VYLNYGDQRVLETNYPMMRKWLDFAETKTKGHILEPYISIGIRQAQWNYLGDWVSPRRPGGGVDPARNAVSARFINNCHYLYTLELATKIAGVLGKPADAALYAARADTLRRTLHQQFFDAANGSYATGEQPYLAFPLLIGVAPPDVRPAVLKNLEETIRVKDTGHLDAGMHGLYFLLKELMEEDRNDLIYEMATKTDYPGWGYMLAHDATTSWESWNGGSHIHDTLISIGAWFIEGIGGIRVDEKAPGFRHFVLKPAPVGDLTFARTQYQSIHGVIVSDWRIENGVLHASVTAPPGTTATLYLPSGAPEAITEGGRPAAQSTGVKFTGTEKGKAVFELASGHYEFASKMR
jgi:hypothetical protein